MASEPLLISDLLYEYATRIWNRIRYSRIRNLSISETILTENFLFDFWYQARRDHLPVEIYEAKTQKRDENAVEIYLETNRGYLLMACQAKLINKFNKYPSVRYKVKNEYQIDLLLRYGERMGGLAFYLFYNYTDDHELIEKLEKSGKYKHSHFGLTVCNAELIKNAFFGGKRPRLLNPRNLKIPRLKDLHPLYAFPLPEWIRILTNENVIDILKEISNPVDTKFKFYSKDEITGNYSWEPFLPASNISRVNTRKEGSSLYKKTLISSGFKPKYRIVLPLSSKQRVGNLYPVL